MRKEDGAELLVIPLLGYKPLIGMIHLPPTPSYVKDRVDIDRLVDYALWEAGKLADAGFNAVIIENYGDHPYTVTAPSLSVLAIARIAAEVARTYSGKLRVGINILRNAAPQALEAALVSGASFIRVNSYCELRVSMEGILTPAAYIIERIREELRAPVLVFADVDVKHSAPLATASLEQILHDCARRGRPDAIIVSGSATGEPPSPGYVASIKAMVPYKPIIIGSGISIDNIMAYWRVADGFIVGTSIKLNGKTLNPVDERRARQLAELVNELRVKDYQKLGLKV
ncbi:BtpA/SgcQ family protein [Hyperthermus butylicus]|uniref:Conserved archaeal protein n=1 Tax=Hyperthermus butylicus (strain DSM 5456 / JCM 9403 / PLM1-5) TaxID=415426 RepID=A2BLV0_HYPBU|nr:BtpA/SgcQ family protein [Hyperthermus butylicus]ABM80961.1 conserved archaeal protein [Hyperthermus butylicus DSM 5456]